jgi:hypothetical protein
MNPVPNRKQRDLRLDFFRGLSLFVILIDHMRGNNWGFWTPANFGFSDAACVFIFISGYTAALAFGMLYTRTTWLSASARVALRVWQLYIAQIATVMIVASLPGVTRHFLGTDGYGSVLKLDYLFIDPVDAIRGLVTLTYVPAYLDILPVYVAMMAMIPLAILIAKINPRLVFAVSAVLWAAARVFHWNLPADPNDGRPWFFDPFTWQFIFFTGFSLGMGWLHAPAFTRGRAAVAVGFIAFCAMLRIAPIYANVPGLQHLHDLAMSQVDKTTLDPLEYLHFLAGAYVVANLMRSRQEWLHRRVPRWFVTAGQQSLAVFLATVVLADLGGIAFDLIGQGAGQQLAVNVACFVVLMLVGHTVAWFKAAPWKQPAAIPALPPDHPDSAASSGGAGQLAYGGRSAIQE